MVSFSRCYAFYPLAVAIAAGCGARSGLLDDGVGAPPFDGGGGGLPGDAPVATGSTEAGYEAAGPEAAAPEAATWDGALPGCTPSSPDPADGGLGGAGCDLAIVIDQSASMNATRTSSGRTRCADAALYAARQFGAMRCGIHADALGNCPMGTTADPPVSVYFEDQMPPRTDDPYLSCTTSKRINVFTFDSVTGLRSATVGINPNPNGAADGWINLADDCQADTALAKIRSLGSCSGLTPLADVMCQLPGLNVQPPPAASSVAYSAWQRQAAKIKLVTDGVENASSGPCSGPSDDSAMTSSHTAIDWSQQSWQWKTWVAVTTSLWSIDTTLFVPSAASQPGTDTETGRLLPGTEEANAALYFSDVHGMNPRRGTLTVVADGL